MIRLYNLAFNLLIFSSFYVVCKIKQDKTHQLQEFLDYYKRYYMLDIFTSNGIWSVELLSSRPVHTLPAELIRNKNFMRSYRVLKKSASQEMMLPLWLRDHNLDVYADLAKNGLRDLAEQLPGEIYEQINQHEEFSQSKRHLLRDHIHRFKQAVREFIHEPSKVAVMNYKKKYEKKLGQFTHHFSPAAIEEAILSNPMDLLKSLLFAIINHIIVMQGVPLKLPAQANIFYSLVLVWLDPLVGQLNLYVMLLNRVLVDPIKSALLTPVVYVWVLSINEFVSVEHMVLMSVLPVVIFYLAIRTLSFQPVVAEVPVEGGGKSLDVTIAGIGCLDSIVDGFIKSKSVSWIYQRILSLRVVTSFSWQDVCRMKLDEIDLSWPVMKKLVSPSIQANKLKTLWIINNRAFADKEADELADMINKNTSLEDIKIANDYEYSALEHIYHLLLWDSVTSGFTTKGAQVLLDAIKDNKNTQVKSLDFFGMRLDESFIESARELKSARPSISITGSGSQDIRQSLSTSLVSVRMIRLTCMACVLLCAGSRIYSLLTSLDTAGQLFQHFS